MHWQQNLLRCLLLFLNFSLLFEARDKDRERERGNNVKKRIKLEREKVN